MNTCQIANCERDATTIYEYSALELCFPCSLAYQAGVAHLRAHILAKGFANAIYEAEKYVTNGKDELEIENEN